MTTGPARSITYLTRGSGTGPITRLMSPGDLGRHLAPFVFLDRLFLSKETPATGIDLHPHSGIATLTTVTRGDLSFHDPDAGSGWLEKGGVEWMRAGRGVWHGLELGDGRTGFFGGFQLWLALPPDLELEEPDGQYIEAEAIPDAGPAKILVGRYAGVVSPVRSFEGVTCLLVTLPPGVEWTFAPSAGQTACFVALDAGAVEFGERDSRFRVEAGQLAMLDRSDAKVRFVNNGVEEAVFLLGCAVPHEHAMYTGHYSIHTSRAALDAGEAHIVALAHELRAQRNLQDAKGIVPVLR